MSWLIAAYAVVVIAIGLYGVRLARLRRAIDAERDAARHRK